MQQSEDAIERLEVVVTETAKAIRGGDLAAMAGLAERAEAALAELGPQTDAERLKMLRDQAGRNALALEAAAKGVRAARRRLAEVTGAREGVQTYDNAGNTQKIGGPTGAIKARF